MNIRGLIWYADIIEKLDAKHQVQPDEVREVLENNPRFRFVEKGHRRGENVYSASGTTQEGRYLIVFFVHKIDKRALILSARDMGREERKSHEEK